MKIINLVDFFSFKAWLESLPPETTFCDELRINSCPIAKYTNRKSYEVETSGGWVEYFIKRYDSKQSKSLQDALEIVHNMNPTAFIK
jgi:hypothetical protein